jgi:hypothetical protein
MTGCATVVSGTSQSIAVASDPPGSTCELSRSGERIGAVAATPASVVVSKSGRMITVACEKAGYRPAESNLPSRGNPWVFGNLLIGGLVGVIVDLASGAYGGYPTSVDVKHEPLPQPVPASHTEPSAAPVRLHTEPNAVPMS